MRLLDLFCAAGGASMGYARAGFDVVGVDIAPQPRYPFEFAQADAIEYAIAHGHKFDAIHASPPCQAYSTATKDPSKHPDLYAPTRSALESVGIPYVIENVIGAPYTHGFVLCGSMFGLSTVRDPEGRPVWVQRHRNFETSFMVWAPRCEHERMHRIAGRPVTVTGKNGPSWEDYEHSRKAPSALWPDLMGMPWAEPAEVRLAIPPSYTEWVGRHLMDLMLMEQAA